MNKKLLFSYFFLLFINIYLSTISNCPEWSYYGTNGPNNWGNLCPAYSTCSNGNLQSPIDLRLDYAEEGTVELDVFYKSEQDLPFINNGHTVEVQYFNNENNNNEIIFDKLHSYKLEQFHFHTPSENTLNGTHYDMEIHFVHFNTDRDILVIGLLINAPNDESPCDFLSQLSNDIPQIEGSITNVDINRYINFWSFSKFYTFTGSLTTPPCTEGVTWIVDSIPLLCSSSQVNEFHKVLGKSNRPIQSNNNRQIIFGSRRD